MSSIIEQLQSAQNKAILNKPKIGGFTYLAEVLRQAGVKTNVWTLPACQSIYYMEVGTVVQQGTPLINSIEEVPSFDQEALINAIRTDQVGESTFPEFLQNIWKAGIIWYKVDFESRSVTYGGANDDMYFETYPAVNI